MTNSFNLVNRHVSQYIVFVEQTMHNMELVKDNNMSKKIVHMSLPQDTLLVIFHFLFSYPEVK